MNVQLEYNTGFLAGVYWEGRVLLNRYTISLGLLTASTVDSDHNIALDRIRYLIEEVFYNCVFVGTDRTASKKLEAAGIRVVMTPELPVDQIIGIILYSKLSAVMEGRMIISQIKISSDLGDNIVYVHNNFENTSLFDQTGWWADPTPNVSAFIKNPGKVVELTPTETWENLELGWEDTEPEDNSKKVDATIVAFKKNDTK